MKIISILFIISMTCISQKSYAASFILTSHDNVPSKLIYQEQRPEKPSMIDSTSHYGEKYTLSIPNPNRGSLCSPAIESKQQRGYRNTSKFFSYNFDYPALEPSPQIKLPNNNKFEFPPVNAYLFSSKDDLPASLYLGKGDVPIETEENIIRSYINIHMEPIAVEKSNKLKTELFSIYFLEMERIFNEYCDKEHIDFLDEKAFRSPIITRIEDAMDWAARQDKNPRAIRNALCAYFSREKAHPLFRHGQNIFISILSYIYCDLHYVFNSFTSSPNLKSQNDTKYSHTIYYGEHLGIFKNFLTELDEPKKETLFYIINSAIAVPHEQKTYLITRDTFSGASGVIVRIKEFPIIIFTSMYNHIRFTIKNPTKADNDVRAFCDMTTKYAALENGGITDEQLTGSYYLQIPLNDYVKWCRQ